jgi:predicted glycoside hydrolase/deacetylase ChbG (UPF0249 family)
MRKLIVNADDFGFTRDVNEGIVACHKDGILTATTLMATGRAFHHAVELSKSIPSLDVGCHLVLVQDPGLPPTIWALLQAVRRKDINLLGELRRQIEITLKAGIRPTHMDTHKHTHLIPEVRCAVLRVSQEYGIPWVRKPADFARDPSAPWQTQAIAHAMHMAQRGFDHQLKAANGRRTDHFTGFQLTGRMTDATLAATLSTLPEGVTELMCHPGFLSAELQNATTRLKQSRLKEQQTLCSPVIRTLLSEQDVQLTNYRDL